LVKVKVKVKVKAVPLHVKQAQREFQGITLPILDPGVGRNSAPPRPLYLRERDPVTILNLQPGFDPRAVRCVYCILCTILAFYLQEVGWRAFSNEAKNLLVP
jgi:hypothetical protein